jgi:apolipoprotein N-acyltransferase
VRRSDTIKGNIFSAVEKLALNPGRSALGVLSGLLLALSFPKAEVGLLAWVGLVPLVEACSAAPLGRVFRLGWLQGFVFNLASLYWIVITLDRFAGLKPIFAVIPLVLLAALLALYTALATWAAEFTARRLSLSIGFTWPLAWTAAEWLRTYFPIGFPWNLLGYSAYRNLEVIQVAELTGIYGVSALIVFFNCVLWMVVFRRQTRREQTLALGTLTFVMVAVVFFGAARLRELRAMTSAGSLKVGMVQGNIPQGLKWDPGFLASSFEVYAEQTRFAARAGAQLVIWPETAAAFLFQASDRYPAGLALDAVYRARLLALAREARAPILFGAPALAKADDSEAGFYNRAYLVSAAGTVVSYYDKMQLVPFGEYVPLAPLLGTFVKRLVHGFGDLRAGKRQTIFAVGGARLAVLICYESIFPELARAAALKHADLLVNITNDSWYGRSSAPYQLLAMAAVRSVETRLPMVRVANTGISAVIQPTGETTAQTPLFSRGTEVETVALARAATFHTLVGDLFAEACLVGAAVLALLGWLRPRRSMTV